jgi:hypothetical protein
MPKSTTRLTTIPKIAAKGELGTVLIQLMMVCNDLTLCNHSLEAWKNEEDGKLQCRKIGAGMYFIRLEIAHMFEAMEIVKRIRDSKPLMEFVEAMDTRTQQSFQKTLEFLDSDDYGKMCRIRNNMTFHYGESVTKKAIKNTSPGLRDMNLAVTLSHDLSHWYFAPSDRVIDQIVVRDIFAVPQGADVRKEVDDIAVRLLGHIERFGDFAGYFIQRYATGV